MKNFDIKTMEALQMKSDTARLANSQITIAVVSEAFQPTIWNIDALEDHMRFVMLGKVWYCRNYIESARFSQEELDAFIHYREHIN